MKRYHRPRKRQVEKWRYASRYFGPYETLGILSDGTVGLVTHEGKRYKVNYRYRVLGSLAWTGMKAGGRSEVATSSAS